MIQMSKALMARINQSLRRFAGDKSGTATMEFVLFVPIFLTVFMSAFESGLLMTRQSMLERAVDVSVRELRLGWKPTHDQLKARICEIATVFPDCSTSVMLELRPISTVTWAPLNPSATCVDRTAQIQPVTTWVQGLQNEMMLVRACTVFDPIFTMTGMGLNLPLDASGGYQLAAASAFVNEPD